MTNRGCWSARNSGIEMHGDVLETMATIMLRINTLYSVMAAEWCACIVQ